MKICRGKVYRIKRPTIPDLERDPFGKVKPFYRSVNQLDKMEQDYSRYVFDYIPDHTVMRPNHRPMRLVSCTCHMARSKKLSTTLPDVLTGRLRYLFCVSDK